MKEGAKARVDYLVQVIYRRKSEVWLLLLLGVDEVAVVIVDR
jgi:hypothetical protein